MNRNYTKEQVLEIAEEKGVELIHLQFTDIAGVMKNVSVPIEQLETALNNQIMFDGSSIDGFVRIEESDMYLYPDVSTFVIFPWSPQEARIICDVYNTDGTPFMGCPRNLLRKSLSKASDLGYKLNVGPECEFFLFNTNEKGEPSLETQDRAGYFDLSPIDLGGSARRDMIAVLKQMGFKIEASHHECAPGQHEIDFKYDDALRAADNIMTFKMVVRIIAQRNGLHATFMPKPIAGIAGSGMHINMSLENVAGDNAFYNDEDKLGLSDVAYNFIAGVLKHAKDFTAVTNPTINSYKRLIPGFEAPVYIAWSASNRSPLVRVPSKKGPGSRIELRSPDPSANPYLALTVILEAGLDGVTNNLTPPEPVNSNIYHMEKIERKESGIDSLPATLYEAVRNLRNNELMKTILGPHAYTKFKEAALQECEEYACNVSQWEVERYLKKF